MTEDSWAGAPQALLKTKTLAPLARPDVVARPRLITRLDEGRNRPLTLISAPPGYGKTTAAVEWLRQGARPFAWLGLDEGDNDPVRFFGYLVSALQELDGTIGEAVRSLLALPRLPPAEVLAANLLNDISLAASDIALVLDDYHLIQSRFIHSAVELLVQRAPPRLHLVLITRQDPPFSLPRLRVREQVTEIRADDLRFSADEAREWLRQRLRLDLGAADLGALQARTEGWVAGLQLAGLSLRGQDAGQASEFIRAFGGSDRYVIDYLVDEVLGRQSEATRRFLSQTAILGRFNAALCQALTGRVDSGQVLRELEQANLFIIPLDAKREWYRYHGLFADVLRTALTDSEIVELQQKAAAGCAAQGLLEEAVEHALAARDFAAAARLIEQVAGDVFQKGELTTLGRWLGALPPTVTRASVRLTGYHGWILYLAGDIRAAAELTQEVSAAEQAADEPSLGRLIGQRAAIAFFREDLVQSRALARQALGLLGAADPFFRIVLLQLLGDSLNGAGETNEASQAYREAFDLGEQFRHVFAMLLPLSALVPNLIRQGRRREALAYCQRALQPASDARTKPFALASLIDVQFGMLHYLANDLDRAEDCVRRGLALYQKLGLDRIMLGDGEWTLIQIQCARGQLEAALAGARQAQATARRLAHQRMALVMAAVEANVLLLQGQVDLAARWAERAQPSLPIPTNPSYEVAYLVLARVRLAQRRLAEASALLDALEQSARQGGRRGRLISILVLQALAHDGRGDQAAALERLRAALLLAAPEDYRRAFLDEGARLAALLPNVRDSAPEFVDCLLQAFGSGAGPRSMPVEQGVAAADARRSPLAEQLSERELDVLRLLAGGKSNAEIARALVVSVGTAKWHVHHVLGKLGAANRTQAVARAREMQLL